MEFPRVIPNSDGAGIVDQIGDGVTRFNIGDRVWPLQRPGATAAASAPRRNILHSPIIW